jgi:two-component system chemotaxis sensor kinase CheA
MAGLVVDQILDIHDESILIGKKGERRGLSGSAVIGGKVTDFLDLPEVLRAVNENWSATSSVAAGPRPTVLVADRSAFSRGLVRNYLELAGHQVVEAADSAGALETLDRTAISAVVMSQNLSSGSGKTPLEQMRERPNSPRIPIVALCDSSQEGRPTNGDFDAYVDRFDRAGLLASLANLSAAVQDAKIPQGQPAPAQR